MNSIYALAKDLRGISRNGVPPFFLFVQSSALPPQVLSGRSPGAFGILFKDFRESNDCDDSLFNYLCRIPIPHAVDMIAEKWGLDYKFV